MKSEIIAKILPVRYESGAVVAKNGQTILKANREGSTTPLSPVERDELVKHIVGMLNREAKA